MTDERHGQGDGVAGTPDGRGAEQASAGATDEGSVARGADLGGDAATAGGTSDDGAARETGAADGEAASGEAATAGDEAGARGTGADDAPPGAEPSGEPAASLADELAEARREAQRNLDRALRAQAEAENVRRRMTRDVENAHKFALERFVSELLPVKDSLELGLAAAAEEGAGAARIAEGVELTLRMLEQAMEKFGVRTVEPAGEPFDPEFHQAITMQESDTEEPGTVLNVVQKGCLLNERLVRPAMVIVAK